MWLLFHRTAGTRVVPGGHKFVDRCPTCDDNAQFHEVEISEQYGVWFVDIVGDRERAYRCSRCGDVFDLRDREPAAVPAAAPARARPTASIAETRDDREARENRLDDELAELKRRMGK